MSTPKHLETRGVFLQTWSWPLVVSLNQSVCAEVSAQHGANSETHVPAADAWNTRQSQSLTLRELADFLRESHQTGPFLFLNERTFAEIGRQVALAHFHEVPMGRRREIAAALADHIIGHIERDLLEEIIASLCRTVSLKAGDKVKTLRGTLTGTVLEIYPDGRIEWRPDGSQTELISPPGGLIPK